jgi:glycosyltransferase involved in cell wall biosynthesis
MQSAFGEALPTRKVNVVRPALRLSRANWASPRETTDKPTRLLFVGSDFYGKGGLETIRAFKKLRQEADVTLTMVTSLPSRALAEVVSVPKITILSRLSWKELEHEFANSHIFVLPTHTDTFGFVFLEAFGNRLACAGPRHFAVPEIIDHGRTGLLFETENSNFGADGLPIFDPSGPGRSKLIERLREPSSKYIDGLAETLARLVDDSDFRNGLAAAAHTEVAEGKYSCSRRAQVLLDVYRKALDDNGGEQ